MKNLLYTTLFIILNAFTGYSQIISINDEAFPESKQSLEELITNVLISNNCSTVDNFESKVFGEPNDFETKSYGYFKKSDGSNFPFDEGLILTTGRAFPAGNGEIVDIISNVNGFDNGFDGNDDDGDDDLEVALGQADETQDATYIKFNFTPQVETISFRFLMASEEYDGYFECYFADSFAFLLREVGTLIYTNLAVLPDGTPVSITNINHASLILNEPMDPLDPPEIDCDSNIGFFEGYNVGHTNYGGRTVALTASSTVTPGVTYEIKLVVADNGDSYYDSAIFLEGGSFNIGGNLGDDRKISTNNPGCLGSPIELDAKISVAGAIFKWYKNGVEIDDETGSTLSVTTDGTYGFEAILDSGCSSSDEIIIEFATPPKIATAPKDILLCESDGNSKEEFDFSGNEALILGTQLSTSFPISYHKDETAAKENLDPLNIPYENTLAQETIWVRIADNTQTCFLVTSFDIEVSDLPIANTPKDFEICDNSDDGDDTNEIATFDLSTKKSEVYKLQSTTDYDVKFYYDQSAADEAIDGSEILVPIQNSSNPQTIFARIEKKSNVDCYSTTSFKLIVNPLPEVEIEVTLTQCDDDTDGISKFNLTEANRLISTDFEDEEFTYYLTNAQAEEGNASDQITNVTNYPNPTVTNSSVFVRIENENDCYRTSEINLVVSATLIPETFKLKYSVCYDAQIDSDNSNGIATFDFSDATAKVLAQLPTGQSLTVSYYTSEADALAETSRIPDISNHRNTSNPDIQQIYVRVDSNDVNACLGLGNHITLTVDPLPIANTPKDFETCDTTAGGNDTNEIATFDLSTKKSEVYKLQSTTDYDVKFYYDQSAADEAIDGSEILVPIQNSSNPQTIFARIEKKSNVDCYSTTSFKLIVNPLPEVEIEVTLTQCDDDTDGISKFNLTEANRLISTDFEDEEFTYYLTNAQAEEGNASDQITNFTNYPNPTVTNSSVFVRIENENDCYRTSEINLVVSATLIPETFKLEYSVCYDAQIDSDNSNGIATFDFSDATAKVLAQLPTGQSLTVSYYTSEADALAETSRIPDISNHRNTSNPDIQQIYVRVDSNDVNACLGLGNHITLTVGPLPIKNTISDYALCSTTDKATFDLTTKNSQVKGSQTDPILISYHLSEQNAIDNIRIPMASNYENISNPQTIYIRSQFDLNNNNASDAGECVRTDMSFDIEVSDLPIANTPKDFEICDNSDDGDDTNEIATFDLSTKKSEVYKLQSTTDYDVKFYYDQSAADEAIDGSEILVPIQNSSNPQTIFARIEKKSNVDCYSTTSFKLIVNPLPEVEIEVTLTQCDDDTDGISKFNLTEANRLISTDFEDEEFTYYLEKAQAEEGNASDQITNVTNYPNPTVTNSSVFVRIENENDCYRTSEINLVVSATLIPETFKLKYSVCYDAQIDSDNSNGIATFDFSDATAKVLAQFPTGQSLTVSYYTSEADALAETSRIPDISNHRNTSNPDIQQIYVRVDSNDVNACLGLGNHITLTVDPLPIANTPKDFEICDNSDDGDDTNEIATFDLSTKKSEVYKLQSTTDYDVKFYYDQSAADEAIDGSEILVPIQNSSNPQTIFARIEKKSNVDCYSTTSFKLIVNPLPEVEIEVTLTQCDDDTDGISKFNLTEANRLISTDFEDEEFTYYLEKAQAEEGNASDQITNFTNYPNPTVTNSSVFVRIENENDCYRTSEINLVVSATLIPETFKLKYSVCYDAQIDSDNSNGIATFDFSDATAKVLAQLPTGQALTVTYYTSGADALAEINPIPDISNHRNTSNPDIQQIYVRVDSDDVNACLGLGNHITLTVGPLPIKNTISDYALCSTTDKATFDLTTKNSQVKGSQTDPILISYHLSEQNAIDNIRIPMASNYENISNPQTIYIRSQFDLNNNNASDAGECVRTDMSFELKVNLNPILFTPDPIQLCSDQVRTDYDLTIRKDQITNNDDTIVLSYFETQTDLDNDNPIPIPTRYTIDSLTETVIVLATGLTGCTSQINLELKTILYSKLSQAPDLEECEIDNNGYDYFDLTLREVAVLNGFDAADFEFHYYEDEMAAIEGNSDIISVPSNFLNTQINTQTIYIRVKSKSTKCFQIIPLNLIVNPVPEIGFPLEHVICLNKNDVIVEPENTPLLQTTPIETGLNNTEYSFQWYHGTINEVNSDPESALIMGEINSYYFPLLAGVYTILATNKLSGCRIPASTTVIESYPPEMISTELLSFAFSENNIIEVTVEGKGTYEYKIDDGFWQTGRRFENISIGEHSLFVRDLYNCNSLTEKKIVIGYNKFFTPNGDGFHDTWNVIGIEVKNNVKIYIFDRYGKLLKLINSAANGWDGTYRGELMPAADYWFTLEFIEPKTNTTKKFSSHFTLKR